MKLRQRARKAAGILALAAATAAFAVGGTAFARQEATPAGGGGADAEAKIASAVSAEPSNLADDATVLDTELGDDGTFLVLREGTNGWFCSPDALTTPGNDPWCFDQTWLDWAYAFGAGEEPTTEVVGLAYMLQGGSDASNSDPFATEPAAGEAWMDSPPHVMLLFPGEIDPARFTSDHHGGGPWVMWAGTPYEHVMMPVENFADAG